MLQQFLRTEILIGNQALEKLKNTWVAVFGIGGVGSYAVEALVRSGIGRLTLIDDDYICITNINRQIHATVSTIGKPKVDVMRDRIMEINPEVIVETHKIFYDKDSDEELIKNQYNYIIDAIDTVSSKIELIVNAKKKNIPIISSMGTGNKIYPEMLEIDDLYNTSVCPLARVMRKELKKRGINFLRVVYSKEEPIKPLNIEDCNITDTAVHTGNENDKRRHVPGSISFVPSAAGLLIAGEVIRDIINPCKGTK